MLNCIKLVNYFIFHGEDSLEFRYSIFQFEAERNFYGTWHHMNFIFPSYVLFPVYLKFTSCFIEPQNEPFFLYVNTWIIDTSVLWILFLYAGSGLYESFDTCISYTRMVKFLSKNTTGYILPWLKSGAKISPSG